MATQYEQIRQHLDQTKAQLDKIESEVRALIRSASPEKMDRAVHDFSSVLWLVKNSRKCLHDAQGHLVNLEKLESEP